MAEWGGVTARTPTPARSGGTPGAGPCVVHYQSRPENQLIEWGRRMPPPGGCSEAPRKKRLGEQKVGSLNWKGVKGTEHALISLPPVADNGANRCRRETDNWTGVRRWIRRRKKGASYISSPFLSRTEQTKKSRLVYSCGNKDADGSIVPSAANHTALMSKHVNISPPYHNMNIKRPRLILRSLVCLHVTVRSLREQEPDGGSSFLGSKNKKTVQGTSREGWRFDLAAYVSRPPVVFPGQPLTVSGSLPARTWAQPLSSADLGGSEISGRKDVTPLIPASPGSLTQEAFHGFATAWEQARAESNHRRPRVHDGEPGRTARVRSVGPRVWAAAPRPAALPHCTAQVK